MSEETTEVNAEAGKRPVFLTVICVLSFIAAGFKIFGYIIAITAMGAVSAMSGAGMEALEGLEGMEGMEELTSAMPSAGMMWAGIIVGFLVVLASLFGVLKMWKLNAQGFMIYAGATVVGIIMEIITGGFGGAITGIVIGGAFIAMYFVNKKHMTA